LAFLPPAKAGGKHARANLLAHRHITLPVDISLPFAFCAPRNKQFPDAQQLKTPATDYFATISPQSERLFNPRSS
jgi:hypothetical protein